MSFKLFAGRFKLVGAQMHWEGGGAAGGINHKQPRNTDRANLHKSSDQNIEIILPEVAINPLKYLLHHPVQKTFT